MSTLPDDTTDGLKTIALATTTITGALGHLGWDYLCHMAATSDRRRLYALDVRQPEAERKATIAALCQQNPHRPEVVFVRADLLDAADSTWKTCVEESDSVVHLAAVNPFPSATWDESRASIDITCNVLMACARSQTVKRVVFASSNHVMGRYKDAPLADTIGEGELTTSLPAEVGTVFVLPEERSDSTAYAVAKICGERLCHALAAANDSGPTYVAVRIGCCKPGRDLPGRVKARTTVLTQPEHLRDQRWADNLYLSPEDFHALFDRAQSIDPSHWPARAIIVNGESKNPGMKWSLREGEAYLGYVPTGSIV